MLRQRVRGPRAGNATTSRTHETHVRVIYDYHHGRDFADEGLELRRPMFAEFTPQLADRYIERFGSGFDGVDFSRYSKVRNPKLKRYNFGFAQLLEPQS
jgi:hypothetical protein